MTSQDARLNVAYGKGHPDANANPTVDFVSCKHLHLLFNANDTFCLDRCKHGISNTSWSAADTRLSHVYVALVTKRGKTALVFANE